MLRLQSICIASCIRFIIAALGHPVLFFCYLSWFADDSLGIQSIDIFGFKAFYNVSTNVYRINLIMFSIFSLLTYYFWIQLQVIILRCFKKYDVNKFISSQLNAGFFVGIFGLLNLLLWCVGMEGNIFGFIVALPLFLLAIISIIIFIIQLVLLIVSRNFKKTIL
jgi:hypothetical protein